MIECLLASLREEKIIVPLYSRKEGRKGGREGGRKGGKKKKEENLLHPSSLKHIFTHTPPCTHHTLFRALANIHTFTTHRHSHIQRANTGLSF